MLEKIRQTEPIAPQLFENIRSAIVEMRLKPGEALSEKDFSLRYGVSRQPIREAFIKLSEAGLLEIRPSRGTYVRKISVREVADARFVREAIECSLVRHAALIANDQDIQHLRQLIEEQETAAENADFASFNNRDDAFHRTIAGIVRCNFAQRTVEGARNQIDRVRYLSLDEVTPLSRLIAQHREIVSSIEAKDQHRSELAMKIHLREILLALPQIARANPDAFEDQALPDHAIRLVAAASSED